MSTASTDADEIAAEIAETRNRLAGTIDQLVYRVRPRRSSTQVESIKASFVTRTVPPTRTRSSRSRASWSGSWCPSSSSASRGLTG